MFGGSINIPSYDEPLQMAGGENNAFTNNDLTNYYLTIPANNIETAFWLESDRMLSLGFSEKSLEVQRNVVIEEFKQRYLNQPYGDVWLNLRPLAYKVHPYQWATIGKDISHIQEAQLDDVKSFFKKYYTPPNAIMCLSGSITTALAKELCEKWFEPIPAGGSFTRHLAQEPEQKEKRTLLLERKEPLSSIYKAWHCCAKGDAEFYATDLLTDVLSRGKSSRLYTSLIKEKQIFTSLNCYMLGELDKSLLVAEGKLAKGVLMADAEKAIDSEIQKLITDGVNERELIKVKQQVESGLIFNEMNIASRALTLCYYEMLGNAADANLQADKYNAVTTNDVQQIAQKIIREENASVLYYQSNQN